MRNLLAFVGAAVLVVLGLGYYLGWYHVTPQKGTEPGQSRLQVDIDQDKIGKDVQQGVHKGAEKIQEIIDKNNQTAPNPPANPGTLLPPPPQADSGFTPPSSNDASLLPPPPPGNVQQTRAQDPPSSRAKEAFKNLIVDGWFSGEKK